jgi:hypothetical protein
MMTMNVPLIGVILLLKMFANMKRFVVMTMILVPLILVYLLMDVLTSMMLFANLNLSVKLPIVTLLLEDALPSIFHSYVALDLNGKVIV